MQVIEFCPFTYKERSLWLELRYKLIDNVPITNRKDEETCLYEALLLLFENLPPEWHNPRSHGNARKYCWRVPAHASLGAATVSSSNVLVALALGYRTKNKRIHHQRRT